MKKIVVFACCFACFNGYCKNFQVNSSDVMALEDEVRSLTGKVEVLERTVSDLKHEIEQMKEEQAQHAIKEQNDKVLNAVKEKQPEELIKIADNMIEENKYSEARKLLQTFINNNSRSIFIGKMRFFIGKSYFREENYKSAAQEFLDSYVANAKGAKAAEALYMLALSFAKLSKNNRAKESLKKVIADYPGSGEILRKAKEKLEELEKRTSPKKTSAGKNK